MGKPINEPFGILEASLEACVQTMCTEPTNQSKRKITSWACQLFSGRRMGAVLYSHLLRDPPRGFAKISIQQILDCGKQLFTVASHRTMGNLQVGLNNVKPLLVLGALTDCR